MSTPEELIPFCEHPFFESAAKLLSEPDPGPTPFLVDELIVERMIAVLVAQAKRWKTWTLLDLGIAIVTGEKALGRFDVPTPGPVLLVLEESGRAALHRRLDKLVRGRALDPSRLADLYFAANLGVRLDSKDWQERLLDAGRAMPWRLIALDPLARMTGPGDENLQKDMAPLLDYVRQLREASDSSVLYVHHTPHDGTRQRGTSDLEAYWESKITIYDSNEERLLKAEHREAETFGPFELSLAFDATTQTVRPRASEGELEERVRKYLDEYPEASANDVVKALGTGRKKTLEVVSKARGGSGSEIPEPPRNYPSGREREGGSAGGPLRAPGTTPDGSLGEVVPTSGNHPPMRMCEKHGRETRVERVAAGVTYLACGCFVIAPEADR